MRWIYWTPLALFILAVGVFFLRAGWVAVTITETDVIEHYAARYVQTQRAADPKSKASPLDCVARPSEERGVWIVVQCGVYACDAPTYAEYHVNRIGNVVHGGDLGCPAPGQERLNT